jgi:hypothetical protein
VHDKALKQRRVLPKAGRLASMEMQQLRTGPIEFEALKPPLISEQPMHWTDTCKEVCRLVEGPKVESTQY